MQLETEERPDLCECCGADLRTERHYAGCLLTDIDFELESADE